MTSSRTPGRETSLSIPTPRHLLARILDEPGLVGAIRRLDGAAFAKLVDHVGLEDAGELVALATPAQLSRLLDEDVWRSARAGQDERFDAARFTVWLEVLLEMGDEAAARKLAELPEELVTAALARLVMVVDLEALAVEVSDAGEDSDQLEKQLDSMLQVEFDQYRVMARQHDGWDALVAVLTALDRDHHPLFVRLMDRCCNATSTLAEEYGGLEHLLTIAEQIESDAAAEREDRRAREGYVSPSQATAFLMLARTTPLETLRAQRERDPVTRAYFREYAPRTGGTPQPAGSEEQPTGNEPRGDRNEDLRLHDLLREARVLADEGAAARPAGLLGAGETTDPEGTCFTDGLRQLGGSDPEAHERRLDELGFLANVLLAGCTLDGRRLRPLEAAEAVTATCNLGLGHELEATRSNASRTVDSRERAARLLATTGADKLFRIGLQLLHCNIALPAARAAVSLIDRLAAGSRGREPRFGRARTVLTQAIADHKPFAARRRLADLVAPAPLPGAEPLAGLLPLLDDIPHLGEGEARRHLATRAALDEARALADRIGNGPDAAHNARP